MGHPPKNFPCRSQFTDSKKMYCPFSLTISLDSFPQLGRSWHDRMYLGFTIHPHPGIWIIFFIIPVLRAWLLYTLPKITQWTKPSAVVVRAVLTPSFGTSAWAQCIECFSCHWAMETACSWLWWKAGIGGLMTAFWGLFSQQGKILHTIKDQEKRCFYPPLISHPGALWSLCILYKCISQKTAWYIIHIWKQAPCESHTECIHCLNRLEYIDSFPFPAGFYFGSYFFAVCSLLSKPPCVVINKAYMLCRLCIAKRHLL